MLMMMKRFLLLIALLVFAGPSNAQTYSLNDFEQVEIPTSYNKELSEWNSKVDQYFHVAIVNGELNVSKQSEIRQPVKLKVLNGYLIGEDHGEFGGGLYFEPYDVNVTKILVNGVSTSTKNNDPYVVGRAFMDKFKKARGKMIPIKPGNIKDIIKYDGKLYTVEGLAHMSFSYGSFDAEVGKYNIKYQEVLKLDDAPMAYTIGNGIIYLATFERFYLIKDWKPTLVANNLFWSALYPNSIAVKDIEHVYVGMRAGYSMINASSGKVEFYRFKEKLK